MSSKFVVSHLDQELGPFEEPALKNMWEKGELLPIDYVYDEGRQDWVLVSELFEWAKQKSANPANDGAPPPVNERIIRRRPEMLVTATSIVNPIATPLATSIVMPASPSVSPIAETKPAPQPEVKVPTPAQSPMPRQIEIKGASVMKEWKKPAGQGAKVKLVDGIGEIDLSPLQPGKVELVLQDSSATLLKLQEPLRINVKATEPVEIIWAFPNQQTVGQEVELMVKALDEGGHICTHYNDDFVIEIRGAAQQQDVKISMEGGQAAFKFQNTKAESWALSCQYIGPRKLRLPEARTLEWQPGAATRLVLDGPHEYLAGQPLKVQVKAVDSFGNLAKTFQGTVILEVKAS